MKSSQFVFYAIWRPWNHWPRNHLFCFVFVCLFCRLFDSTGSINDYAINTTSSFHVGQTICLRQVIIKCGVISCPFSHISAHTWHHPLLTTAAMLYGDLCFTVALCLVKRVAFDANEHEDTYCTLFPAVLATKLTYNNHNTS